MMKRILRTLLFSLAALLMAGCTGNELSSYVDDNPTTNTQATSPALGTTVDMYYTAANGTMAKSNFAVTNTIAKVSRPLDTSTEEYGYFYIRMDGRLADDIDGIGGYNMTDYFPQTPSHGGQKTEKNKGITYKSQPFYKYYGQWHGGQKINYYIVDPSGELVNQAIVEAPTLDDLIDAHHASTPDLTKLRGQTGIKIIWYVYKQQNDGIHVDGVLTYDYVNSIEEIPGIVINERDFLEVTPPKHHGEVEVDIHQQIHNTWNEIKTSIHMRDFVDATVTIPIENTYLAEADDFAIRTFEAYYTIDGVPYPVNVNVTHGATEMTIQVTGLTQEMIADLKHRSDDGLTIEINSYYQGISHADVWTKLKNSRVTVTPEVTVKGQITSAIYPSEVVTLPAAP